MVNVTKNNPNNFFNKKKKQLFLGGPGYNPEQYQLFNKKFSEMFDGLIFIKNITVPNYNLNAK
jgi:erythromycin esterase